MSILDSPGSTSQTSTYCPLLYQSTMKSEDEEQVDQDKDQENLGSPKYDHALPEQDNNMFLHNKSCSQKLSSFWKRTFPRKVSVSTILCIFVVIVVIATPSILVGYFSKQIMVILEAVRSASYGEIYFSVLLMFWTILCLPTTPMEIASGFLFGFYKSLLPSFIGKTVGSLLSFCLGKYLLRKSHFEGKLMRALERSMKSQPWRFTFLVRIAWIPMAIKNYGLAFLPCTFFQFCVCSIIGGIPYTLAWSEIGSSSSDLLAVISGKQKQTGKERAIDLTITIGGVILLLVLVGIIRHYAVREMRKSEELHNEEMEKGQRLEEGQDLPPEQEDKVVITFVENAAIAEVERTLSIN